MKPKFRAWHKKEKKMLEIAGIGFDQSGNTWHGFDWNGLQFFYGEVILMQSTGLKDKNGKEIFEGDIIVFWWHSMYSDRKVESNKGVIEFRNGEFGFFNKKTWYPISRLVKKLKLVEVIGNAYENPELIEEAKK